ncbi:MULTISPECIES: outer membrane protein assembly factor BamD [Galbibacter]|uniref:Outer membrane protein assembly factor BamD n=1 Tax=Galbibacter pacificus TaxID=2996052 RepID=A0ABT6FRG2_9FLAO|nr:outer membrane protein assembly factor BamD [Galbibacter pacificus]MDG3581681.1 outer membrane protein assembly factor BamD [Galbibacter pacificus]MDG3585845.1 outer membrane protein assembly factor BamD [Galbibacter pacificus]
MKYTYLVVLFAFVLTSCSEYQKTLKDSDVKKKYELAEKLYDEGDYKRANRLFEQIVPQYVGKPQGERLVYFFANSYYQTGDYYLAAYQFERFTKSYPRSDKAEEAAFLGAKSQYLTSPRYSLDQTETNKAIDRLQIFINTYPNSEYMDEANKMAADMRAKLEKKAFEIAKQYNRISDYNASIKSFELFFKEFPGSVYKEDALYYDYLAKYNLAVNSIPSKKEERINNAKAAYQKLISEFENTQYKSKAEKMDKDLDAEMIELKQLIEQYSK